MSALATAQTGAQEAERPKPLQLFELKPDKTRPTNVSVAVSGNIDLDLSQKADVDFWNELQAGKLITKETTFFVAGAKKRHRRDSEGNVDAVVETKSLIVDGVTFVGGPDA
jgi:hypothetical protein